MSNFLEKSGIKLGNKWYMEFPHIDMEIKKAFQVETKIQEVKKDKDHKCSNLAKRHP